jgi:hypothetical protein
MIIEEDIYVKMHESSPGFRKLVEKLDLELDFGKQTEKSNLYPHHEYTQSSQWEPVQGG